MIKQKLRNGFSDHKKVVFKIELNLNIQDLLEHTGDIMIILANTSKRREKNGHSLILINHQRRMESVLQYNKDLYQSFYHG